MTDIRLPNLAVDTFITRVFIFLSSFASVLGPIGVIYIN
jgi:hypothetical protein